MGSLNVHSISSWSVPNLFYAVVTAQSTGDDTGAVGGLVPRLNSGGKKLKSLDAMQSDTTEYLLHMEQQFKYPIRVIIPRCSSLK